MTTVEIIAKRGNVPVTVVGSLFLVTARDAQRLVDICEQNNIHILGIDGFHIRGGDIYPDMNAIADFSSLDFSNPANLSVNESRRFLLKIKDEDMFFDFTLAD